MSGVGGAGTGDGPEEATGHNARASSAPTAAQAAARWATRIGVPLLLLLFAISGSISLQRESATFDETAHLPAGLSYLQRGDFRLNPEHPPLAKAWAALPARLLGLRGASYQRSPWRGARDLGDGARTDANEWIFGYETLNGPLSSEARADPRPLLHSGRHAMLALAVLLGLLLFAWSRSLWGSWGGLLSLALYATSPTMLAHGRLVTTDLPAALAFAATIWAWSRWSDAPDVEASPNGLLDRHRLGRLLVAATSLGLALGVKFSAILLLPVVGVALLLAAIRTARARPVRAAAVEFAAATALTALVVVVIIWAMYGFRFSATADAYRLDWSVIGRGSESLAVADADAPAWLRRGVAWKLLPEAYLYGFAYVLGGAARRLSYLNGETSIVGWWTYFPVAFLLKTPLATLAFSLWSAIETGFAVVRRRGLRREVWLPLLASTIYVVVSLGSSLNIGHRHLAPLYPLLFLAVGALAPRGVGVVASGFARWRLALIGLLLVGQVGAWAIASPGYLSYFNALAGGVRGGGEHLLDSNLDWGQDLPALARWMEREGVEQVHLAYFGTADPRAYGIEFVKLKMVHDFYSRRAPAVPPSGAVVAISANLLYGLYLDTDQNVANGVVRRGWVPATTIQAWAQLREAEATSRTVPALLEWLVAEGHLSADRAEAVRRGLLATYVARLREQEPIGRAGGSIWLYRAP